MALHGLGFGFGQHVELETLQPAKQQWGGHAAAQTVAAIVGALVTVIVAIKGDPKLAWALAVLIFPFVWIAVNRAFTFLRMRLFQARRNEMARARHAELRGFVKQFAQFNNTGDWSGLRYIVTNASGNNPEKCAEVMPPDYMHDLCQFLVQDFETRSENEREFLLAVQKMYGYIASYNREYVNEPFRKMRMRRWYPAATSDHVAEPVRWIESLPPMYRENTERQIEDFRERWVGFLDDVKKWLEKMNETFGVKMPSYFDRPQKL